MLQMQFLRSHPVLQNQKLWGWAHVVYFNKPSRWLWCMAKHGTTSNEQSAERWVHGRRTTLSKLHYVSVSHFEVAQVTPGMKPQTWPSESLVRGFITYWESTCLRQGRERMRLNTPRPLHIFWKRLLSILVRIIFTKAWIPKSSK